MPTVLADLFTPKELDMLSYQTSFSRAELDIMQVQKLTITDLLNLGIPLMYLEKQETIGESKNLCIEAIKILWKRAIERNQPIFSPQFE
jgi:hypothetical protein